MNEQIQMNLFGNMEERRKSILISIQDVHFDKIVNETKHYEYRFTFGEEKTRAYIYIPRTRKHIEGYVDFGTPIWMGVKQTCELYEKCGDGYYKTMEDWLAKKKGCYVIPIEKVYIYEMPITLTELSSEPEFVPPQSYINLDDRKNLLKLLENRKILVYHKKKERRRENSHVR